MLKRLYRWFRGYLCILVYSDSCERFINLCANRGFSLEKVRHLENAYQFEIALPEYWKIKSVAVKTKTLPLIRKRKGFPFWFQSIKKRKIFAGGFFLFLALLFLLSQMVWDIQFSGCYTHTEEELLSFLRENEVYCGAFHQKIDYKETEDLIRLKYPDIGWVSVERKGTRLLIQLKETQTVQTAKVQTEPAHLIAPRDGVVVSIVTRSGTPLVHAGDTVKKGDILVSGVLDIVLDNVEVINRHAVRADADVVIQGEEPYFTVFDMEYDKKVYTGNEQKRYQIQVKDKFFEFSNPFAQKWTKENAFDTFTETVQLSYNKALVLPIIWSVRSKKEYEIVRTRYTEEEAIRLADRNLQNTIENLQKKGVSIVQNNVKIETDGSLCTAKGLLQVEEKAAEYSEIDESEWRIANTDEQPDGDHNGSSNGT